MQDPAKYQRRVRLGLGVTCITSPVRICDMQVSRAKPAVMESTSLGHVEGASRSVTTNRKRIGVGFDGSDVLVSYF